LTAVAEEQPVPQEINTECYLAKYVVGEVSEGTLSQSVL
jgi:hypothetical protein